MKFTVYNQNQTVSSDLPFPEAMDEGIGIFETLRVYHGRIFRMEEHLKRLEESAKTAGFGSRLVFSKLRELLYAAIRDSGKMEAVIRLTLIGSKVFILIGERRHDAKLYQQGVSIRTSPVRRSLSHATAPESKTSAYHNAVFASIEPSPDKVYEWLFLDRNGYVTEVRIGNIFIVRRVQGRGNLKYVLETPPTFGILNGVTRRFVIECASSLGIQVCERILTRHEVFNASEAFLTNTSWEVLAVRELDGRRIGEKSPGPVTLKIHQEFKRVVRKECQIKSPSGEL